MLGNRDRGKVFFVLPFSSPYAAAELLGSESGMKSGESSRGPLGEGSGLSIHMYET